MDGVKTVALSLLHTDIHKTKYAPAVVQHPFTSSGLVGLKVNGKVQLLDITEDEKNLRLWREQVQKLIENSQDPFEVFMLINKPYGLTFLKYGYEDMPYHNAVFVGRDEKGIARHAHKRSTNSYGSSFRMNVESSDPRYSFHRTGTDGTLFVFEAPIDLMSFITMFPYDWEKHSYVACCGTSFQPVAWMLEQMDADKVYLCLDNDVAGQKACARMEPELLSLGLSGERLVPARKDWNDDLTAYSQRQEAESCQTMCGP